MADMTVRGDARTETSLLAIARATRGLSQTALAAQAGVTRETVNRIERGRHAPSLATALALGRAVGCDVTVLFEGSVECV
jgi:putative transcriptional regulator